MTRWRGCWPSSSCPTRGEALGRRPTGARGRPGARRRRGRLDAAPALRRGPAPAGPLGEYGLQAAIAAVHDQAASADETDWPTIVALYERLETMTGTTARTAARPPDAGPGADARHPRRDRQPRGRRRDARRAACGPGDARRGLRRAWSQSP